MPARRLSLTLSLILASCAAPTTEFTPVDAGAEEDAVPPADRTEAVDARPPAQEAALTPDAALTPPVVPADAGAPVEAGPAAAFCGAGTNRLGPPTAAELKLVDDQFKASPPEPAGTNQGNNFAYGGAADRLGQMRSMYGLTGDLWYLDRAIKFADHMLAARNHPDTGRVIWTGKREPCWPNKADTAPDAAYCGPETGAVASQLLQVASMIFQKAELSSRTVGGGDPNAFGATYGARARTYLREAIRTMDWVVAHFVDPSRGNQIHSPADPGYAALGPTYAKAAGRSVPWNQQDMVTGPLSGIDDILLLLNEEPARVAANRVVIETSLDWFIAELLANQYVVNGVTVYKWGYNPGDLKHVENLAHASADINALFNAYRRGRLGIERATLVPIANTFHELVAKTDGTYAAYVDGTGMRAAVSTSWTNYEEFRPGIVARLVPALAVTATTPPGAALTALNLRKRFCR